MYLLLPEITMHWMLCFLFNAFLTTSLAAYSCKDQKGRNVDWYFVSKLPLISEHCSHCPNVANGSAFLYMDSNDYRTFTMSEQPLTSRNQAVAYTLQQLYDTMAKGTNDSYYIVYNDQQPGFDSSYRGHAKGVQLFDTTSGFWLIHSVPRFPPKDHYEYPPSGLRNGQSMLCVTFKYSKLGEIAEQTYYMQTAIYKSNLAQAIWDKHRRLGDIVSGMSVSSEPYTREAYLQSKGGAKFVHFAKHKKWPLDLYADLVAPGLRTSLLVETWLNGNGDLHSSCSNKYPVHNLREVRPSGIPYLNSKDHSKWAVSDRQSSPWVCVGDINRQQSQDDRAGGTMCTSSERVWSQYYAAAAASESCDSKGTISNLRPVHPLP